MNRINAPDGTPLVYDAYESTSAQVAVLSLHDWHPQPAETTEPPPSASLGTALRDAGYSAYFLDQRGHGRSGGTRGHLSRFSQLLGDLQAFRRVVRRRRDVPQVLIGQGFGGLVVLRYLETQPGEPPAAAVVANPWLAWRRPAAPWKRIAAKLADLWPTLPTGRGAGYMTAGARAELQWAQRAVRADHQRIERPTLFLVGGADRVTNSDVARQFAESLAPRASLESYPDLSYELFTTQRVVDDVMRFIAAYRPKE